MSNAQAAVDANRRARQMGFRDGYAGRPARAPHGRRKKVYTEAYRRGEQKWRREQEESLEQWKVDHA